MGKKTITVIPAKDDIKGKSFEDRPITRVVAYVRVSSLPQEESYESQEKHFRSLIDEHPDWKLVKIYGDEGISGLSDKNRAGFQSMMMAARRREFDLILAKSISRLCRNTVLFVSTIRELKSYGISCRFEKENIDTAGTKGELMITMLSAFAQSESESISENTQIGFRYKHARGDYSLAYGSFLGFDKGEDGVLRPNSEQAATIRYIYEAFLSGMSLKLLCNSLEEKGFKTGTGKTRWHKTTLKRILTNEKMFGAALLEKTTTVDVLNKVRVRNEGIVPSYFIENDHEPIIDKQTALLARGELMRRNEQFFGAEGLGPEVYNGRFIFTRKLKCQSCGSWYNHRYFRGKDIWECNERIKGNCGAEIIRELELKNAVLCAAEKLWEKQPEIRMNDIPMLAAGDEDQKLIRAAVLFSENTFADKVRNFLKGECPVEFSGDLIKDLVEQIRVADNKFIFFFYGTEPVMVDR